MSSSFLKPVVTPVTALATSARARPCSARCSSVARSALSTPSFCSKVMPCGSGTVSLPFGPCTSTWPACSAIFTPAGTGIGLRPIRDICCSLSLKTRSISYAGRGKPRPYKFKLLPNLAENFAAYFGFAGRAAAHQAFRRGENVDAQAAYDRTNIHRAEVAARAWPGNALHSGDDAAAVRRVLQEHAQHLAGLVLVHQLEGRDVALFLENAGDFGLQFGHRHVHALVLGRGSVADARQKIGYGIRLHLFS